ncbi:MAG: TIGR02647 family protein [Gammaproteobacteria bacterium]|nr:TIGR02647 family protein [Gammaproteobacteria bacterium]
MTYTNDLLDELNILLQFNLETTQEGIKIHRSAGTATIDATTRLFNKGLVTQADGGYLTDLGHIAAEHAQTSYAILTPVHESSLKPASM